MTFSQEVKNEICKHGFECDNCSKAMLYGMLYCCKGVKVDNISLYIENRVIVDFFTQNLIDLTSSIITVKEPNLNNKKIHEFFTITIENIDDVTRIIEMFFDNINDKYILNTDLIEYDCCHLWFLRGVFLLVGSVVDPNKEYHLEFSVRNQELAEELSYLLKQVELDFKVAHRAKNYAVYVKESSKIEDTLTVLGANNAYFDFLNLKIEREVRNNLNRTVNCETANIGKTVNASVAQIKKIQLIRDTIGFEQLKPQLQEVALLRLMNPESSLTELCELSGNTLTKSGLNYRLKKLIEIADKIENESSE